MRWHLKLLQPSGWFAGLLQIVLCVMLLYLFSLFSAVPIDKPLILFDCVFQQLRLDSSQSKPHLVHVCAVLDDIIIDRQCLGIFAFDTFVAMCAYEYEYGSGHVENSSSSL